MIKPWLNPPAVSKSEYPDLKCLVNTSALTTSTHNTLYSIQCPAPSQYTDQNQYKMATKQSNCSFLESNHGVIRTHQTMYNSPTQSNCLFRSQHNHIKLQQPVMLHYVYKESIFKTTWSNIMIDWRLHKGFSFYCTCICVYA